MKDMNKIILKKFKLQLFKATGYLYWYTDDLNNCYISDIKVLKIFRNKGYGTKLVNLLETKAKEYNFKTIYLWVLKDSWLFKWYEKLGYSIYKNRDKNYIWMYKNI